MDPRLPDAMTVGVFTAPGAVELRQVPVPTPGPGEVLLRVHATAICTWEQRTYSGAQANRFPFLGGHEIAGEVVAVGPDPLDPTRPVPLPTIGARVAVGYAACGRCHWCLTGQDRACPRHLAGAPRYGDAWGPAGFAAYRAHPADAVFDVGVAAWESASLTEPLACAVHAAVLLGTRPARDAVVIGAGVMGLLNVVALKAHGARVIVCETDPSRLPLARRMGAAEVVDATAIDPVAAVRDLTEGRGAEAVVTAVGDESAYAQAMAMLAPRGRVVLFAAAHPEPELTLHPNAVHAAETSVLGAMSCDTSDFYTASRLVRYGMVDLAPLVQATRPLAALREAMDEAVRPGTYRVVINP